MTIQEPGVMDGQSATAAVIPADEAAYWSENYAKRAYVEPDRPYADYEPAFQHGWESRARLGSRPFREIESELERGWEAAKGASHLVWAQAKKAVSDAWHRAGRPAQPVGLDPMETVEPKT
jgi:hypothetical protein